MKTARIKASVVVMLLWASRHSGFAQGFVNLTFQEATITPDPSSPYYPYAVYSSSAIPGWTTSGCFLGANDIFYNDLSTGSTCITLVANGGALSPIDGAYSILLYGGTTAAVASISQTGLVPGSVDSLLFKAQYDGPPGGSLAVSLGGQDLSFSALMTGSNYTLYGATIPNGLAGQTE
jgi:hypothetical protein